MIKLRRVVVLSLLACSMSTFAASVDVASPEKTVAVAMVKKAVAYLKTHGAEKAYAEFSNPAGQFKDRDLYIAVLDVKGVVLAHGDNAKLVGKATIELKDVDGTYFIKKFLEVAHSKGSGWVDYKWPNPISKVIEQKSTYVERAGDVVITCGAYKG